MKIKRVDIRKHLIFFLVLVLIISSIAGLFYFFIKEVPKITPQPPRNLTAMLIKGEVMLSWEPPSNNGSSPLIGYRVYRNTTQKDLSPVATIKNATKYIDSHVYPGNTYYYYVTAYSNAGESNRSNMVKIKVLVPPSPPQNVRAMASSTAITLLWNPPLLNGGSTITNYRIYRGTSSNALIFLDKVNTTMYADRSVLSGFTYYYRVSAVNSAGESKLSPVVEITTPESTVPPSAPRNLQVTMENDTVVLTWKTPRDDGGAPIEGYRIYRGLTKDFIPFYVKVGNITRFVDTNISIGETYYYQVSAVNIAGDGVMSEVVSIYIPENKSFHGYIQIDSNDDFRRYASWGNGTPENPWVIENYTITQEDVTYIDQYLILIENTSAPFIIKNCTLSFSFPLPITGIYLKNVSNGIIENNSLFFLQTGVHIENSARITLRQNTIEYGMDGFHIENSEMISMVSNKFEDDDGSGITAEASRNVRIIKNYVKGWGSEGIYVDGERFFIYNNTINNEFGTGIEIHASNSIVKGNIVENAFDGISLEDFFWWGRFNNNSNVSITDNTIRHVDDAIYIGGFGDVTIRDNLLDAWQNSILLYWSVNDTISGNRMYHSGIYIGGTSLDFWVTHNMDSSNLINGLPLYFQKNKRGGVINSIYGEIILANCSDFIIRDITITNTSVAIIAGFSQNISINNTILSNNFYNVVLWNVTNSTLKNNLWSHAYVSLLAMSYGMIVENNTVSHSQLGFDIWGINNTFRNNTVMGNEIGVFLNAQDTHILHNRIIYNYEGIGIMDFCVNSTVERNFIRGNRYGIHVYNYYAFIKTPKYHGRILNNTITENLFGIDVEDSGNITLEDNKLYNNSFSAVLLDHSSNVTLENNFIADNSPYGVHLYYSKFIIMLNNRFQNDSIFIEGDHISFWNTHVINSGNLVNGKPVYYLKNQINQIIPSNAGEVILANCTHIIVENVNITQKTTAAILLGFSNFNMVKNVTVANARWGIALFTSSNNSIYDNSVKYCGYGVYLSGHNNTVIRNMILGNGIGVYLEGSFHTLTFNEIVGNYYGVNAFSQGSLIYLNDFINNTIQAYDGGKNYWDNGSVGNYWSDYNGTDTNSDGIGDTPYIIPGGNSRDERPLIRPIPLFHMKFLIP